MDKEFRIPENINTTIETISGTAMYSHTQVEDTLGIWNDNWYTSKCEYVIHEGKQHHVFIVK